MTFDTGNLLMPPAEDKFCLAVVKANCLPTGVVMAKLAAIISRLINHGQNRLAMRIAVAAGTAQIVKTEAHTTLGGRLIMTGDTGDS